MVSAAGVAGTHGGVIFRTMLKRSFVSALAPGYKPG
jgi:hypothetical protein